MSGSRFLKEGTIVTNNSIVAAKPAKVIKDRNI